MERKETKEQAKMEELEQDGRVPLIEFGERKWKIGEKRKSEVKAGVKNPPSSVQPAATFGFANKIEMHHNAPERYLSRPPLESSKRENMETAFAHRLQELAAVMAKDARSSERCVKEEQEQEQERVTAGSFHRDEKRRER